MNASQLLFLVIVFAIICGLAVLGMVFFSARSLRERLAGFMGTAEVSELENGGGVERVAKVAQPFIRLSVPEEGWEKSALRTLFVNAGWHTPAAPTLYFAAKTVPALGLPAAVALGLALSEHWLAGQPMLLLLFTRAAFGCYLLNVVLSRIATRRRRDIFETIPDTFGLLTVCAEAGLSLERALIKVAAEIHIKSLVLAQELQLV